jgi:hypothetical protein
MSRRRRRRSDFRYRAWHRIQHHVVPMVVVVVMVAPMNGHSVDLDAGEAQGIPRFPGPFLHTKLDVPQVLA